MLIKQLWPAVSIQGYHKIKPLTGTLDAIPSKFKNLNFSSFEEWFESIALRAQNDCNIYLDFAFNKFEFSSFAKEIKDTVIDMVYVLIEHWIFNRVPIEFFVDATNTLNTSNTSYVASNLANNMQDMLPQRVKALANLTQLKHFLIPYMEEDTIDANMVDLGQYYTKFVTDNLLFKEKKERLQKQLKWHSKKPTPGDKLAYSDQNDCPVNHLVIEEYATSEYDRNTETLTISFPKQIGTLPPQALQTNPQVGDYTHAPTADFVAKMKNDLILLKNQINSFIGQISWFMNKKNISEGWVFLSDKKMKVLLANGQIIETPKLREGDFIRHKLNSPLVSEKDCFKQHKHDIDLKPDASDDKSFNSAILYDSKSTTKEGDWFPTRELEFEGVIEEIDSNEGSRYLVIDKKYNNKIKVLDKPIFYRDIPYNKRLYLKDKTKEEGKEETRPQNLSLIAHMYVGVGAKLIED